MGGLDSGHLVGLALGFQVHGFDFWVWGCRVQDVGFQVLVSILGFVFL